VGALYMVFFNIPMLKSCNGEYL